MSVNSSSSSNDSFLHSNISDFPLDLTCFTTRPSSIIFTSYTINNIIFLLPLCIFIIYHGLQQWGLNCSTSTAATMSHSDSFTYNMVAMELIGVVGCMFCSCGVFSDNYKIFFVGFLSYTFTWFGEMFFHVLTCVERYLAVVHPITYLSLRKQRGIRIRNISIGCVWLLCSLKISLMMFEGSFVAFNFCLLASSLATVSFCSISVLCVLIRPGPGEQGGNRKRVDQSKQRAFYTIMVILGVLVLRFTCNLAWAVLYALGSGLDCLIITIGFWFNLPCSLVLPLLFLHRAGKLMSRKKDIQ